MISAKSWRIVGVYLCLPILMLGAVVGLVPATPVQAAVSYYLPYPAGKTYTVTQGPGGSHSHGSTTNSAHAIDFNLTSNDDIAASAPGILYDKLSDHTDFGRVVYIQHSDGKCTIYAHMSSFSAAIANMSNGSSISQGQVLGKAGDTGDADGVHLHFGRAECSTKKTIDVDFVEVANPVENQSYTSQNASAGSGVGPYQPFAGDFNGDGVADIGLRKASNGNFFMKLGPNYGSNQDVYTWAAGNNYEPFVADFNGDGLDDIGLRNVDNGNFFIKHGPNFGSNQTVYTWVAGSEYKAFAGDFNGDGVGDIGLRKHTNGNFFIKYGPTFGSQTVYTWATGTGFQPYVLDHDADGKSDIGLRNISNGNFFIKHAPSFSDQFVYTWASGTNYQAFAGDRQGSQSGFIGLRNKSNGNFYIKHGPNFGDQVVYTWAAD